MTRSDDDRLLPRVKRTLARWTAFGWPDAGRNLKDADGTPYAVLTKHRSGEWYAFAAKKQLRYGGVASFMPRLVEQARDVEAVLVLFVGTEPAMGNAYAFDPDMVVAEGETRHVNSKRRNHVEILDVEADRFGVNLGEYLAGRVDLPEPNRREPTGQRTFGTFGVGL